MGAEVVDYSLEAVEVLAVPIGKLLEWECIYNTEVPQVIASQISQLVTDFGRQLCLINYNVCLIPECYEELGRYSSVTWCLYVAAWVPVVT